MTASDKSAKLRNAILLEVAEHPISLIPLGVGLLAGVWALTVDPSPLSLQILAGGLGVSVLGGLYNLALRGPMFRDRVLHRWEKQAEEKEDLTKRQLREAIEAAGGSKDILELFDQIEVLYDEVAEVLESDLVAPVKRAHFQPMVEENYAEAIALFNRLAFLQERLSNLIEGSRGAKVVAYEHKIAHLRNNRKKMMGHLRRLAEAMEKVSIEVPDLADRELASAERNLRELEESLDVARRAYEDLHRETDPRRRSGEVTRLDG
ncbi:MAG: hypothetical protein RLY93_07605 [Sumerlaeia bacterium]